MKEFNLKGKISDFATKTCLPAKEGRLTDLSVNSTGSTHFVTKNGIKTEQKN